MTPADRYKLGRTLLMRIVFRKDEIRLGEACREMDRLLRERDATECTPREIARNLRALGFEKAGTVGSGYDREPLYRRREAVAP
jgi:hypothetical protein